MIRKIRLLTLLLFLNVIITSGCAWVAYDREYFIQVDKYDEIFISDLLYIFEGYFESNGFELAEKHAQTLPDDWWVIIFQPKQIKNDIAKNCRDLSICIRSYSDQTFSIIYRIECIEGFFGKANLKNPEDIWTITKDGTLSRLLEKSGINFKISFIEERYARFGKCDLW